MKTLKIFAASSLFALAFAAPLAAQADATVIDFESNPASNFFANSSITSNGFVLAHTGSFAYVWGTTGQGATDFSGNGTNRVTSFNTSELTLTSGNGSNFSISSFEGGESWVFQPHSWATQIRAVGTFAAGGSTSQTFDLDLIKNPTTGLQVFNFNSSFNNLRQVAFTGIGGNPEFTIDNIQVNAATAVPEPESYAMMLAGLGLFGFIARRRRQA